MIGGIFLDFVVLSITKSIPDVELNAGNDSSVHHTSLLQQPAAPVPSTYCHLLGLKKYCYSGQQSVLGVWRFSHDLEILGQQIKVFVKCKIIEILRSKAWVDLG